MDRLAFRIDHRFGACASQGHGLAGGLDHLDREQALRKADDLLESGGTGPQEEHVLVAEIQRRRAGESLAQAARHAAWNRDADLGPARALQSFADLDGVMRIDDPAGDRSPESCRTCGHLAANDFGRLRDHVVHAELLQRRGRDRHRHGEQRDNGNLDRKTAHGWTVRESALSLPPHCAENKALGSKIGRIRVDVRHGVGHFGSTLARLAHHEQRHIQGVTY